MLKDNRGLTLVETLMYIAVLAVLLPALTIFLLNSVYHYNSFDLRSRLESSASMIISYSNYALSNAISFNFTSSTLGVNQGAIYFKDSEGKNFLLSSVTNTSRFGGELKNSLRLRLSNLDTGENFWLTDPDLNLKVWKIYAIRNSSSTLKGAHISIEIEGLESSANSPSFNVSTTIFFSPGITEL